MIACIKKTSTEDFHGRLGVRIVGRLQPDLLDSNLLVEFGKDADEVVQAQVSVDHKTLDLMEFCEVSVVEGLVAEDSIDREELSWSEWLLLGDLFQVS